MIYFLIGFAFGSLLATRLLLLYQAYKKDKLFREDELFRKKIAQASKKNKRTST